MPWKDAYTLSDEVGLGDDQVVWPDSHIACMNIVVDLSLATGPEGITASDLRKDRAQFGLREGLDLTLDVLKRFGLRATLAVPAAMGPMLAPVLRTAVSAGHEIAVNGFKHEDVSQLERDEEAKRIATATATLGDVVGERPLGWYSLPRASDPFAVGVLGPNTLELVRDAGYDYFGNGLADDIPHYCVTDFEARSAILAMPYYYHFDDQFFLLFPRAGTGLEHADTLAANWQAELDAQYQRGRHFHMVLHPHAIAWCNRLDLLETFFGRLPQYPGLWNPTSAQCARHWLDTYPAATHLHLEESIWVDHEGSLS